MGEHLVKYGFTPDYIRWIFHGKAHRMRDEAVRQHIDECDADGRIGDMLDNYEEAHFSEGPQEEEPKATTKVFYEMLEAAQKPLHGQTKVSQLDGIGCLMALKSQFGLSRDAFDSMLTVFCSMLPEDHICPKCKASRFLEVDAGDGQPKRQHTIPVKIVCYLPFIQWIQRLYMTEETAK